MELAPAIGHCEGPAGRALTCAGSAGRLAAHCGRFPIVPFVLEKRDLPDLDAFGGQGHGESRKACRGIMIPSSGSFGSRIFVIRLTPSRRFRLQEACHRRRAGLLQFACEALTPMDMPPWKRH